MDTYITTIVLSLAKDDNVTANAEFDQIWTAALKSKWTLMPFTVGLGVTPANWMNEEMSTTLHGHLLNAQPSADSLAPVFGDPPATSPWRTGKGGLHEGDTTTLRGEQAGVFTNWQLGGSSTTHPPVDVLARCEWFQIS